MANLILTKQKNKLINNMKKQFKKETKFKACFRPYQAIQSKMTLNQLHKRQWLLFKPKFRHKHVKKLQMGPQLKLPQLKNPWQQNPKQNLRQKNPPLKLSQLLTRHRVESLKVFLLAITHTTETLTLKFTMEKFTPVTLQRIKAEMAKSMSGTLLPSLILAQVMLILWKLTSW